MHEQTDWISTTDFAELARVSPQAARKAIAACLNGGRWRGCALQVRKRAGPGGLRGLIYEVAADSLPVALRRASGVERVAPPPKQLPQGRSSSGDRLEIISAALAFHTGSAERARAITAATERHGISGRTLYRWISRYEEGGAGALNRTPSPTAHDQRVVVSRAFDEAVRNASHSPAQLDAAGAALCKAVKGLWASRAETAGSTEVRRLAEFLLLEHCEAAGLQVPRDQIRISRRVIEQFAHYRVVNQRRNDRKSFEDGKPRIRRDWTGLAPMERVIADVKHLDVVVTRPDGSPAWPKIVGFMDAGTGRVFVYPVLLDPGEGVRQEHVIEAFLAMVSDPAWGFPQSLYLDNGKEFAALDKMTPALRLLNDPGAATIIYAIPYNASAKPIESLFARLDRYVFCLLPGYAGPDRLKQRRQKLGKPPSPYPGSWTEFCSKVQGLIAAHNQRPVGGQWRNRSPQDWYASKVQEGWRPTTVEPLTLDAAFADHDSRQVDRGIIRFRGQRLTHPALAALPSRTVVDLAVPWRRGAAPLAHVRGQWVQLTQETVYPARWLEGARESRRRERTQTRYVSELAKDAPAIDPVATKIRWSERTARPLQLTSRTIDLGSELGVADRPAARPADTIPAQSPAEARRARQMALTERLERRQEEQS